MIGAPESSGTREAGFFQTSKEPAQMRSDTFQVVYGFGTFATQLGGTDVPMSIASSICFHPG